ncbi:hypothetical protein HMPREF0621_1919 [Pasteurella dagmatis ATCC 43325]|uniref:Uncharacterized protein n=1 Tax=Pasteurella dagmatis ATCC 43325 TaxID=667128 RepID=C9PSE5_9PAST|nr:hypothetical protein HMPREF0621_1919 [Pasteurella dagmatis ATCC 43325]
MLPIIKIGKIMPAKKKVLTISLKREFVRCFIKCFHLIIEGADYTEEKEVNVE